MKNKIIILFLLILFMPLFFIISSCGQKLYTNGDFQYYIIKNDNKKMAFIHRLSDEGKEKEIIIIPKYIDNYEVYGMNDRGRTIDWGKIESQNLKRIYITSNIKINPKRVEWGCMIFSFDYQVFGTEELGSEYYNGFLPYNINIETFEISNFSHIYNANVTYFSNYDDSIYWIDDYSDEKIKYQPEIPKREGYKFAGWFKEKECINEWDFFNDLVPPKKYDENGNYIYENTELYAKWII